MDIIFLRDIKIQTIVGVYPRERVTPQTILLDLELGCDITEAAETRDITKTIDYHTLAKSVIEFIQAEQFELLETLAESTAQFILNQFGAAGVKLSVRKPRVITELQEVGITIERGKKLKP